MLPWNSYTMTPGNQFFWKATSHESVFTSSPKSFAEEVANELCKRVQAIGGSHPSVVIGKQKKLMEGLMNVAEAIRDLPKQDEHSVADDAKVKPNISMLEAQERSQHCSKINQDLKDDDILSRSEVSYESLSSGEISIDPSFIAKASVETFPSGEISLEPNSVHLRLSKEHSEFNCASSVRFNKKSTTDEILLETDEKQWKPTKPKRNECGDILRVRNDCEPTRQARLSQTAEKHCKPTKLRRGRFSKKKERFINFFQSKFKKPESEKKLNIRDRITAFFNNERMRNFRKGLQFIWSPKKSTVKAFSEVKNHVFLLSKL